MTALMFAIQHGYFDIIQMFVSNKTTNLLSRDSVSRNMYDCTINLEMFVVTYFHSWYVAATKINLNAHENFQIYVMYD